MLLLKRLSTPSATGDIVHGVIRAGVSTTGAAPTGSTAPNPMSQSRCGRRYARCGIDPGTVG